MRIVRAKPGDAARLSAIAWAAKAHWGYPLAWLEQWRELLTITPSFIAAYETHLAKEKAQIAGFHALVEKAGAWRLEHLWVQPRWMGRGLGRSLFQHAATLARARGANCLTIESDPNADAFYRRLGAVRTGLIPSEVDGARREVPILRYDLSAPAAGSA